MTEKTDKGQIDDMKRNSKEFKDRFMARVKSISPLSDPLNVYFDYMYFVGETSDGFPEDEADDFRKQGGI